MEGGYHTVKITDKVDEVQGIPMTDLNKIRQQISLTALAEEAGAKFDAHHMRSRCPLPRHAGDRSSLSFVTYENGMKWKCHSSCPSDANGGDVISFYMAWKEVDFKTAVQELSEWTGSQDSKPMPAPAPKQCIQPQKWKERAAEFIAYAEKNLNDAVIEYLRKERGLSEVTARAFHVGYNPQNIFDDPIHWGLDGRKIWLPRGIVIPGLWRDEPHYIKIRRPLKNDPLGQYIPKWDAKDGASDIKFGGPRGGKSVLFRLELLDHLPVLILTEGEWDTMLLWEHCADLCDAGTIGGAQSRFDLLDLALLTGYQKIFVVHDDDKAGDKGRDYIASMKAISPRIESISPPSHDLTDFWRVGGDLRVWVAEYVTQALQGTKHPRWMKVLTNARQELPEWDRPHAR
jgi:hypothetical protein